MGILDEAIREHLELKRRRGATDSELQRLEDEAFGPPSRPGEPDFPEREGGPAEQSGNGVAHQDAVAESAPPALPGGEQVEEQDEPDEQDAAEAQTAIYDHGPDAGLELGESDLELDEEVASAEAPADQEPQDVPSSEPPIETLDTAEHELPEEAEPIQEPETSVKRSGPEAEGEETSEEEGGSQQQEDDVLADTPDFLREVPEDDELWFEQGRPKDFDF